MGPFLRMAPATTSKAGPGGSLVGPGTAGQPATRILIERRRGAREARDDRGSACQSGAVAASVEWVNDDRLVVDGVELWTDAWVPSTPDRFFVNKPPALLRAFVDLLADLHEPRIVELGTASGGSAALIAL